MRIVPIFQKEAFAFIAKNHRHHKAPIGSVFQVACDIEGEIVGVAVVGRPVGRMLQDGFTLEVTRLCTDGSRNVCSMLYAACWRAAKSLGYTRLITYILASETGITVRAAGFKEVGVKGGGSWNRKCRTRIDTAPTCPKILFERR